MRRKKESDLASGGESWLIPIVRGKKRHTDRLASEWSNLALAVQPQDLHNPQTRKVR